MKKRLMVLGGNPFQAPLAKIGKQRGYEVCVVDRDPSCEGKAYADLFVEESIAEKEACLEIALRFKPHGVCTAGTDFTTTVAYVCEGLEWIKEGQYVPYHIAELMSNKLSMRRYLREVSHGGVLQPGLIDANASLEGCYPVIVKPAQSMGTRGVRVCWQQEDVVKAIVKAVAEDPLGRVIVEEFLDGCRYLSTDSMWLDGRMVFLATADRKIVLYDEEGCRTSFEGSFPVEVGHDVPAQLDYSEYQEVKRTMLAVGEALGYRSGFIKGDLMLKDGKCYVGEVAARVSGSFNSGCTVPLAYGFDLHGAVVDVAMGERDLLWMLGQQVVASSGWASERTLVAHKKGKIVAMEVSEEARLSNLVHVWCRVGEEVSPPRTNMEKLANVVGFSNESAQDAVAKAEGALSGIRIEID